MPHTRNRPRQATAPRMGPSLSRTAAIIPFDYAARFELTGEPGRVVEDVISVSPEGVFVAVAIGYGFDEDRARRLSVRRDSTSGSSAASSGAAPATTRRAFVAAGDGSVGASVNGER